MVAERTINAGKWTLIGIIALFLTITTAHLSTTFKKVEKPELILRSTMSAVKVSNVLDCAFCCLSLNCDSFYFNESERRCEIGNCAVFSPSQNSSKEMYLSCNSHEGFRRLTSGLATVCVWVSNKPANYTTARDNCNAKGAHLYTVKTVAKLRVLQANYRTTMWIGMNDMAVEGTYRWEDDGSECVAACRAQIFAIYQPDNSNNDEDCIMYYYYNNPMIYDGWCPAELMYICEKPCFNFI